MRSIRVPHGYPAREYPSVRLLDRWGLTPIDNGENRITKEEWLAQLKTKEVLRDQKSIQCWKLFLIPLSLRSSMIREPDI
jgi:hypothetical protein